MKLSFGFMIIFMKGLIQIAVLYSISPVIFSSNLTLVIKASIATI